MSKETKFPYEYMNRMYKPTKGQNFGRPTLKMKGKEFDIYDWIQENRDDTEIIPTLEKYGCLDRMKVDDNVLYGDMTEIMSKGLRGILEHEQETQELWDSLPWEYRQEFQNNKALFIENGEKWLKNRIEKTKESKEIKETTGKTEGDNSNA